MFSDISEIIFKSCKQLEQGKYLIQLNPLFKKFNPKEFEDLYNYSLIINFYNQFGQVYKFTDKQNVITFYYPMNAFWKELTTEFCGDEVYEKEQVDIDDYLLLKDEVADLKILLLDMINIVKKI